jgi:hypothetical protein
VGAEAPSVASVRRLFGAHPPAGADGEARSAAIWVGAHLCRGEASGFEWSRPSSPAPYAGWSGLTAPPASLRGVVSAQDPPQSWRWTCLGRGAGVVPALPSGAGPPPLGTPDSSPFKFLGSFWGRWRPVAPFTGDSGLLEWDLLSIHWVLGGPVGVCLPEVTAALWGWCSSSCPSVSLPGLSEQ